MYNFYNSVGLSTYNVQSPILNNPTNAAVSVSFQFAAANRYTMPPALQTVFADDHIILEYSTDQGISFTPIYDYEIGRTGELNTGGTISSFFTPNASQWVTKTYTLPAGTNRVNFKGIKNNPNQAGNFAYIDNVTFKICTTSPAAPTGNSPQNFCSNQTLSNLVVNGRNIKWYPTATGLSALSGATVLTNGTTYYATQTVDGCESSSRLPVTVTNGGCLAVDEVSLESGVSVYPNPAKDKVEIKSKAKVVNIKMFSADAKLVKSVRDMQITSISINHLEKGVYYLELTFENGVKLYKKIIKE